MRRIPVILLLLAALPLPAAFRSNALGMDLGYKESLDGTGYEGERAGNTTTIYKDGEAVMIRAVFDNGYLVRENGREERVVTDSSGRRISRTIIEGGRTERTVYEYDGDRLSSQTVVSSDGIERRIEYIDSFDGMLAGQTGNKSALYDVSFYLYEAEDGFVKVTFQGNGESMEAESYELSEDGSWASGTAEYGSDGLLRERTEDGVTETFFYDEDGAIFEKHVSEGTALTVYHYSEGIPAIEDLYQDGVIIKSFDRSDPGSVVETRYTDGVMTYRITYDGDGKRIKRVENLR